MHFCCFCCCFISLPFRLYPCSLFFLPASLEKTTINSFSCDLNCLIHRETIKHTYIYLPYQASRPSSSLVFGMSSLGDDFPPLFSFPFLIFLTCGTLKTAASDNPVVPFRKKTSESVTFSQTRTHYNNGPYGQHIF